MGSAAHLHKRVVVAILQRAEVSEHQVTYPTSCTSACRPVGDGSAWSTDGPPASCSQADQISAACNQKQPPE
ncbi:hypothetical protein Hanom_Chr03g00230921 [Helianthus anomalus]